MQAAQLAQEGGRYVGEAALRLRQGPGDKHNIVAALQLVQNLLANRARGRVAEVEVLDVYSLAFRIVQDGLRRLEGRVHQVANLVIEELVQGLSRRDAEAVRDVQRRLHDVLAAGDVERGHVAGEVYEERMGKSRPPTGEGGPFRRFSAVSVSQIA